jgi:hypothetical protein
MSETALSELDFTSAKAGLSKLMDEVVHLHKPRVVARHGGREAMLLVRPDDLARWLDTFRFSVLVTLGEGDAAAELRDFGVVGVGSTVEEAIEDLVIELRSYARRFFEQAPFYMETDRARHYPWLLRFALTPADRQLELLYADIEAANESERKEAAPTA